MQGVFAELILIFQRFCANSGNLQAAPSVIQYGYPGKEACTVPKLNRQTAIALPALVLALLGVLFALTDVTAGKVIAALLGAAYAAWRILPLHSKKTAAPAEKQAAYLLIPAAVLVAAAAIPGLSPDAGAGSLSLLLCAVFLGLQAAAVLTKKAHALLHIGLTVSLILKLIHDFRLWSVDPQVSDYCFRLFALLCTLLAALYHGGMALRTGKRRLAVFLCLFGIVLCGTAAGGSLSYFCFFLGCALYLLSFLLQLLKTRKKRSAAEAAPQPEQPPQ